MISFRVSAERYNEFLAIKHALENALGMEKDEMPMSQFMRLITSLGINKLPEKYEDLAKFFRRKLKPKKIKVGGR